jgi:hypothetical protein
VLNDDSQLNMFAPSCVAARKLFCIIVDVRATGIAIWLVAQTGIRSREMTIVLAKIGYLALHSVSPERIQVNETFDKGS